MCVRGVRVEMWLFPLSTTWSREPAGRACRWVKEAFADWIVDGLWCRPCWEARGQRGDSGQGLRMRWRGPCSQYPTLGLQGHGKAPQGKAPRPYNKGSGVKGCKDLGGVGGCQGVLYW